MKTLKSLNNFFFLVIILSFFTMFSYAEEEPVDIWNIEQKPTEQNQENTESSNLEVIEDDTKKETDIFKMQSQKKKETSIKLDEDVNSKEIELFGLYDPEDYDLDINMWLNSDGFELKRLFTKLNKIELSKDANEIMKISLLTNAHHPKKNIKNNEFLTFKSNWLIKNLDLKLIEDYLKKNQILNLQPELTKFLVDQHLSMSEIDKACEIFSNNLKPIEDEYLLKFNIYCLIINNKNEEAQVILDLNKELGFSDKYFEKKISYLLGYDSKVDESISLDSILDFHLAHKTNPDFFFEPDNQTKKIIWKYLSSSNLLNSFQEIDVSELDRISTIEKAVHDKNYSEKDLFEIYKQFQFNINQLLNAQESYKSLSNIEARALVYQKILLESGVVERLKLLKTLKRLFDNDNLNDAFDLELKKFLQEINPENIPANLTSFYYTNIKIKNRDEDKKIKFNNDVLHQSKLINYFNGDYSKSKIEKDINNFLKKIKKNKKYFFSKKDQIFLESLKYDGIQIQKKYDILYNSSDSEIPTDIQVMINNNDKGSALLRIIEVIGQDELNRIDEDTIYFIISTLNQLDIDFIRNKILLKVLPLKI